MRRRAIRSTCRVLGRRRPQSAPVRRKARSLNGATRGITAGPRDGIARIFIYAPAPESFRLQSEKFAAGKAYVLYITDLPLPPQ